MEVSDRVKKGQAVYSGGKQRRVKVGVLAMLSICMGAFSFALVGCHGSEQVQTIDDDRLMATALERGAEGASADDSEAADGEQQVPVNEVDAQFGELPKGVQVAANTKEYAYNPLGLAEGIAFTVEAGAIQNENTLDFGRVTFSKLDGDNDPNNDFQAFVHGVKLGEPIYLDPDIFTPGEYEVMLTYPILTDAKSLVYMATATGIEIQSSTKEFGIEATPLQYSDMSGEQQEIVTTRANTVG